MYKITKKITIIIAFLIITLLFSIKKINALYDYITPKGVHVSVDVSPNTLSAATIEQYRLEDFASYPNIVEIAPANNAYNCHSYALYSRNSNTNDHWFGASEEFYFGEYNENLGNYDSSTASYVESDYSPRDILVYIDIVPNASQTIYLKHSAVIYSNNNNANPTTAQENDIMVISKWDDHGLYLHDFRHCPYYAGSSVIKSYRPYYDVSQTITDVTDPITQNFTITDEYRKIVKLNVVDTMDLTLNVSSSNGAVNAWFYDAKMQLIDDNLIRYYNNYSGSYVYHLTAGTYYYSVFFENPNTTGTISCKLRVLDDSFSNAIMLDPGSDWLCGSEMNILATYNPGIDMYGYNTIHNGFTRLMYFNPSYVSDLSRLDYYYGSTNPSTIQITNYGTILAKNAQGAHGETVYAFNKNDPTLVYKKEVEIVHYNGSDIYLYLNVYCDCYDEFYLDIENVAPFNFLQYYTWTSTNTSIATVDALGYTRALQNGTCYINGEYIYNNKVHLRIQLIVS